MDGVRRVANGRRLLVVGWFALLVVGSFALTLVLLSKENSSASSAPPRIAVNFDAKEVYVFDSLDQMVATSDLVATGTVTEVLPGEIEGARPHNPTEEYPEGRNAVEASPSPERSAGADEVAENGVRYLNTVVTIDQVLKGSAPASVVTVETLKLEYGTPGMPSDWRKPGTRVLLYLKPSTEPEEPAGFYQPTNHSQSVYVLQDRDLISTVRDPSLPLSDRVASLSLPELRQEVEQAKERISRGEVKALEAPALDPNP